MTSNYVTVRQFLLLSHVPANSTKMRLGTKSEGQEIVDLGGENKPLSQVQWAFRSPDRIRLRSNKNVSALLHL